jgi:hypothetical protein
MGEVVRYPTPVFRLSFPSLFEAESYDGGPPKFGLSAVWDLSKFSDKDKKMWKGIKAAMDAESKARFKKPLKDLPSNFKIGIRDGLEGYGEGKKFANLTTKMRPGVIDANKNKIGPEEGNAEEIYPGCYCRATITVYSYDNKGKGIALGLMNVQKVADGERLDSRSDASEDFDDDIDDAWLEQDDDDIPFDEGDEFLG